MHHKLQSRIIEWESRFSLNCHFYRLSPPLFPLFDCVSLNTVWKCRKSESWNVINVQKNEQWCSASTIISACLFFAFGAGVCLCKQTHDSQSQKVSVPAVRLFSYLLICVSFGGVSPLLQFCSTYTCWRKQFRTETVSWKCCVCFYTSREHAETSCDSAAIKHILTLIQNEY